MCYRTLIKELQDNWRILGPMTVAEGGGLILLPCMSAVGCCANFLSRLHVCL